MTCDCVAKVNEMLAGNNTKIVLPMIGPQRTFVETCKVDEKKRGKPSLMFASFCPFCGSKYPPASKTLEVQS
jgi:hypothetical protein